MANSQIVPEGFVLDKSLLPEGFILDEQQIPLPEGFVLDSAIKPQLYGRDAALAYRKLKSGVDINYQPKQFTGQNLGAINQQGQPPPSTYQGMEISTEPIKQLGREMVGTGEAAAQIATGIPAFVVDAGIAAGAGYGTLARGGNIDKAASNIEGMQELVSPYILYQPKTEEGKRRVESIGKALHWLIGKPSEIAGETGQAAIAPIAGVTAGAVAGAGIQTLTELAAYMALFGTITGGGKKLAGIKEPIKTRPLTDKDVKDFDNFIQEETVRLKGKNLNLDDILEALRGKKASEAAYDYIKILPVEGRVSLARNILKGRKTTIPPIEVESTQRGLALPKPDEPAISGRRIDLEKRKATTAYIRSLDKTPDELYADETFKAVMERIRKSTPEERARDLIGEARKPTEPKLISVQPKVPEGKIRKEGQPVEKLEMQQEMETIAAKKAQGKLPIKPVTLTGLIRKLGGISLEKAEGEGLAGDVRQIAGLKEGGGNLINNKTGIGLERILESAKTEGFVAEDATLSDLLNAIDKDIRQKNVVSRFDEPILPKEPRPEVVTGDLDLKIGSEFKIEGEKYIVKGKNEEGKLIIEDGERFEVDPVSGHIPSPDVGSLKHKVMEIPDLEGLIPKITPSGKVVRVEGNLKEAYTGLSEWTDAKIPAIKDAVERHTSLKQAMEGQGVPKEYQNKILKYRDNLKKTKKLSGKEADLQAIEELGNLFAKDKTDIEKQAEISVPQKVEDKVSADTGGYAPSKEYIKSDLPLLEAPEMLELAKEINEGKLPHIVRRIKAMAGNALGIFKEGDIKLKADTFQDPDTTLKILAHEIGHLVDWVPQKTMARGNILGRIASLKKYFRHRFEGYGGAERNEIMKELKNLTQTWKPFNPSDDAAFTKYRHSSKELYADAFSVLLNDPNLLREKAPIFEKAFFNWLDQKPEVKKVYDKIIKRTPEEKQAKVEKSIEEMFAKGEEAHRAGIEPPKGMVEHLKEFKGGFKKELVDRFSPLYDTIKDPIVKKKVKMAIEDMLYREAETEAYLIELQKIIDGIKNVGEIDLGKYMFLKRAATERKGMANPVVVTGKAAVKYLEGFKNRIGEAQFNKIEEIVKNFFALRKKYVFAELEKAGLLEPKLLELLKNNPDYATFDVIHYILRRAGSDISKQIHEQIGTLQEVANVFTSTVLKDIALMRIAIQTIAKKAAIKALTKDGLVKPANLKFDGRTKIPVKPIDPDLGLIEYFDSGKVVGFYVPKEIAETFKRNPVEAWKITQFFRAIANPFREIFVHKRPGFAPFNAIRDFLGAVQTTPGMTITNFLPVWLKSLPDAHRRTIGHYDPEIVELLKGKALIPSVDYTGGEARDISQYERLLVKYRIKDSPQKNLALRAYDRFAHWLNYLSETSETTTKFAVYRWLKEHTDLPMEDIMYTVRWTGSPAFLIKGEATPLTNNILLFSNPMIQGWRWQAESAKAHPKGYTWKYAKYSFFPTLLKYVAYAGFLGAGVEELMRRIGKYDLTNYYIIPLGETPDKKTVYLRIPHNETMRTVSGLLWKGLTSIKDTSDIFSLLDYTVNQFPGLSPAISIPMDILTFLSGNNVYDSFRGKMAIPEMVMAAKDDRTKEAIAKYLSNKAGLGIVYKFDTSDPVRIKGQLEKILGYPIASDILGRFIKISDVGTAEHISKDVVEPIRTATARYKLDVFESVNALVVGKTLTKKQWLALGIEEERGELDKKLLKTYMRSHGNAWLKAILNAKSEEEKIAIIDTMLKEVRRSE